MAVKTNVKGNASTNPVPTFDTIKSDFVGIVGEALETQVKSDDLCRAAAKCFVALRGITTYEGRQATAKNPAIPAGPDWNGLSGEYRDRVKAMWTAAISEKERDLWVMRTGKPASAMPIKKNIDYYVEVELQNQFTELFGAKAQSEYEKRGLKWGTRYQRAQAAAEKRAEQREQAKANGEDESTDASTIELLEGAVALLAKVTFSAMDFAEAIKATNLLREIGLRQTNLEAALNEALTPKAAA